jgi:hypothetical protein
VTSPEKARAAVGYAARELAAALDAVDAAAARIARRQAELVELEGAFGVALADVARFEAALRNAEQAASVNPPAPDAGNATGSTAGSAHNPMVRITPADTPKEP